MRTQDLPHVTPDREITVQEQQGRVKTGKRIVRHVLPGTEMSIASVPLNFVSLPVGCDGSLEWELPFALIVSGRSFCHPLAFSRLYGDGVAACRSGTE